MKKRYLVAPLETIPGAQLPSAREVLGLVIYKLDVEKKTISVSAHEVSLIVEEVWARARIPMQRIDKVATKIKKLHKEYALIRKNKKRTTSTQSERENKFGEELNDLFDVAHADAMAIMKNEEDKDFLLAQREPGRRGRMGGVDLVQVALEERVAERHAAQTSRQEKALYEATTSSATAEFESDKSSSSSTPASSPTRSSHSSASGPTEPKRAKRGLMNVVTPGVAAALDRTKVSDRAAVYVLTETARSLGHNPEELNINRSSIRHQRRQHRERHASSLKEEIMSDGPLIVHWDGKLMMDLTTKEHVDRLPILVSGKSESQLLRVAKLPTGSGTNAARAVVDAVQEWGLTNRIVGMGFDTTAANTGHHQGACVLIERALDKDLLYFACRHHILEIMIGAVFLSAMGTTAGPDVGLFRRFQAKWELIDQQQYVTGAATEDVAPLLLEVDAEWFRKALDERKGLRDDYRELMELTLIFIGGIPSRGVRFLAPGPMHHARWMSKVIYSLKVWMFRKQFRLTTKEEQGLRSVSVFAAKIYSKAWTEAPLASAAPRNDLAMLQALDSYSTINKPVAEAALKKMLHHLWYLSEELVALALFDKDVTIDDKRRMQAAIKKEEEDGDESPSKRPTLAASAIAGRRLEDFATAHTSSFFRKMHLDSDFLDADPAEWPEHPAYQVALAAVHGICVTNDHAERGVALIQEYNRLLTRDEDQLQFLLQVVADHRRLYPDARKQTLAQTGQQ